MFSAVEKETPCNTVIAI